MSPQRSNRQNLIEGALRCLERLPAGRVTARAIAAESGANLASIRYHFGSKDDLVAAAAITGLDRWLDELDGHLEELRPPDRAARLQRFAELVATTRPGRSALSRNFAATLAQAQHDERIRDALATGFRRTRARLAAVLDLGADPAGEHAAGLVHSLFTGLTIQALLDPELAIEGDALERASARLLELAGAPSARG